MILLAGPISCTSDKVIRRFHRIGLSRSQWDAIGGRTGCAPAKICPAVVPSRKGDAVSLSLFPGRPKPAAHSPVRTHSRTLQCVAKKPTTAAWKCVRIATRSMPGALAQFPGTIDSSALLHGARESKCSALESACYSGTRGDASRTASAYRGRGMTVFASALQSCKGTCWFSDS